MRDFFLARKYPDSVVDNAFQIVKHLKRESLIMPNNPTPEQHKIPLVLQFHPMLTKIPQIVHKNWHYLSEDEEVASRFSATPITAYCRGKNLKELLTLKEPRGPLRPGTFTCSRTRCLT